MMQARIATITTNEERGVKGEVTIDIHNGREWHHDALTLYCDNIHEGARLGIAICDALDKLPDTIPKRLAWTSPK